jgi:hypothetical protein
MQNHCCCAANGFLFSITLIKTSFQRVPENKNPMSTHRVLHLLAVRTEPQFILLTTKVISLIML